MVWEQLLGEHEAEYGHVVVQQPLDGDPSSRTAVAIILPYSRYFSIIISVDNNEHFHFQSSTRSLGIHAVEMAASGNQCATQQ